MFEIDLQNLDGTFSGASAGDLSLVPSCCREKFEAFEFRILNLQKLHAAGDLSKTLLDQELSVIQQKLSDLLELGATKESIQGSLTSLNSYFSTTEFREEVSSGVERAVISLEICHSTIALNNMLSQGAINSTEFAGLLNTINDRIAQLGTQSLDASISNKLGTIQELIAQSSVSSEVSAISSSL